MVAGYKALSQCHNMNLLALQFYFLVKHLLGNTFYWVHLAWTPFCLQSCLNSCGIDSIRCWKPPWWHDSFTRLLQLNEAFSPRNLQLRGHFLFFKPFSAKPWTGELCAKVNRQTLFSCLLHVFVNTSCLTISFICILSLHWCRCFKKKNYWLYLHVWLPQ